MPTISKEKKIRLIKKVVSNFNHKIDPKQLSEGIEIEKEHSPERGKATDVTGTNKNKIAKIATVHLKEDPKYYTHLKKMEDKYAKS